MVTRELPLLSPTSKNEQWNSGARRTIFPLCRIAWNGPGRRKRWFCAWPSGGEAASREITLEFHDPFNQVVLRDKQRLFSATAAPLAPNDRRDFQLGYETLPVQWNQAYPTIRITGLQLQ